MRKRTEAIGKEAQRTSSVFTAGEINFVSPI